MVLARCECVCDTDMIIGEHGMVRAGVSVSVIQCDHV